MFVKTWPWKRKVFQLIQWNLKTVSVETHETITKKTWKMFQFIFFEHQKSVKLKKYLRSNKQPLFHVKLLFVKCLHKNNNSRKKNDTFFCQSYIGHFEHFFKDFFPNYFFPIIVGWKNKNSRVIRAHIWRHMYLDLIPVFFSCLFWLSSLKFKCRCHETGLKTGFLVFLSKSENEEVKMLRLFAREMIWNANLDKRRMISEIITDI